MGHRNARRHVGEIGCQWPWTDLEKRVLAGAAVAHQETGGALTIHPARHEDHPWMLVEFLRREGADMSRTIIDHIDRTIFDDDRLFRLAGAGVILEWDLFGQEVTYYGHADIDMPNDGARIKAIRRTSIAATDTRTSTEANAMLRTGGMTPPSRLAFVRASPAGPGLGVAWRRAAG